MLELHAAYQNAISKAKQFPFVSASVFEIAHHLENRVDFAFSSFLRHQLGTALDIQDRFRRSVGQAVKEGGVWVDIGKEFVEPPNSKLYQGYEVDVYKIEGGKPKHIGTPFVLQGNQIDIEQVNTEFFKAL